MEIDAFRELTVEGTPSAVITDTSYSIVVSAASCRLGVLLRRHFEFIRPFSRRDTKWSSSRQVGIPSSKRSIRIGDWSSSIGGWGTGILQCCDLQCVLVKLA